MENKLMAKIEITKLRQSEFKELSCKESNGIIGGTPGIFRSRYVIKILRGLFG